MLLSFRIKAKTESVFDYLTDMQKFVTVHPVINKIEPLSNGVFLIYETLMFAFIPYSFKYTATIESDVEKKTVTMCATVMRITKITMTFVLKNDGDSTLVDETVQINSPLPVAPIIKIIFKKQHQQLFKNLEAKLKDTYMMIKN